MILIVSGIFDFQFSSHNNFLLSLQTVLWNTVLVKPSPRVILPRFHMPNVCGRRRAGRLLWRGHSASVGQCCRSLWRRLHVEVRAFPQECSFFLTSRSCFMGVKPLLTSPPVLGCLLRSHSYPVVCSFVVLSVCPFRGLPTLLVGRGHLLRWRACLSQPPEAPSLGRFLRAPLG